MPPLKMSNRKGRPPSHGMHGTRTYHAWLQLRAACDNPRNRRYDTTGGRGITYPTEWNTLEGFMADVGKAPPGAKFRRRDTSQNFSVENCYWEV